MEHKSVLGLGFRILRQYGFWRSIPYSGMLCLEAESYRKTRRARLGSPTWRELDFQALGLKGKGKLLLDPEDRGLSICLHEYGFREPLNTHAIYRTVEDKEPEIIDIGSNLGYFALIALEAGASTVTCVEPLPDTVAYLTESMKNRPASVVQTAVGEVDGTCNLQVGNQRNYSSLGGLPRDQIVREITVRMMSLSSLSRVFPFSMINMDVEGYEHRILSNKIPDQVNTIALDMHTTPAYPKSVARHTLRVLDDCGFRCRYFVKELRRGYYPIIKSCGLSAALKLAQTIEREAHFVREIDLTQIDAELRDDSARHMVLER